MTSLTSAKEAADGPLTPETPSEYLNEKRSIPLQDVNALDYDCDSLSDGREKADTTPENLKKIDDVISEQRAALNTSRRDDSLRSHFWSHPSVVVGVDTTTINPITTTTNTTSGSTMMMINFNNNSEPVLRVDESERKLDMDKSSPHLRSSNNSSSTTNDSLGKRDHNESATNATPAMVEGRNNGSYKTAVSPNNNYDESSIESTSTTATKQSFAFTIDNFNDKDCDPAAAQAKYKSMLERFQQRHRRGASMSKLENTSSSASGKETLKTSTSAAALMKSGASAGAQNCDNTGGGESAASPTAAAAKVKLRPRDRSTSRVRDANKRHSWSPRSSTSELTPAPANTTTTATSNNKTSTSNHQQSRSTTQRQEAMPPQSVRKSNVSAKQTKPQSAPMTKATNTSCVTPARQQFTPRSTAMQLALQKVDFMCAQPPLADFKHLHIEADNISETGTYTLDGDNYTEEQKDLMNIDKSTLERAQKARRAAQVAAALSRPTDLELSKTQQVNTTAVAVAAAGGSRHNVLEINYFHESETPAPRMTAPNDFLLGSNQSASSYLEKIKSRVLRNMTVTKNCVQDLDVGKMMESSSSEKTPPSSADVGTFTSVTTSGVLAKQSALDARPKLTRRSSLSTSQIDSSEYVSNEVKLKQSGAAAYAAGGFTDHQKAEYRLNVFTNQKDTQHTFSAPNRSFIQTPPDSPAVYKPEPPPPVLSDAAVLKTAQNKNDWIQEWARNARARSLASCDGSKNRQHLQTQELMTRSYTCSETGNESLTDDSVFNAQRPPTGFSNKTLASRYRLVSGEFDYASDPALSTSFTSKTQSTTAEPTPRPPKSPSKIPSPLHSLGRARSASRTRASLQNMLQLEAAEADSYLQKTAAAINNLQQSLSRKNSLQSPAHSGSPRAGRSNKSGGGAYYSPEEISPQHSLESPTAGGSYQPALMRNAHKRNLSMETYNRDARAQMQLMTSSFNEQQLQLLTGGGGSGDYGHHRQRGRKNSFDGNMQMVMPNSPVAHRTNWCGTQSARGLKIHEQQQTSDPSSMSPLRRSSSFSAKVGGTRTARPQFQNIYTPPAARQNYVPASGGGGVVYHQAPPHGIKKSASSNNFGNVYSDYDENLAYYIKDEDEYGDDDDDDDLGNDYYSSGEDLEHEDYRYHQLEPHSAADARNAEASEGSNVPLTNTRLNKALLMRIERSKQKVAGGGVGVKNAPSSATSAKTALGATIGGGGVVACPNTPELPRRNIKSAPRSNVARQSMPRDSSLNRLAGQIPNSLASAKKQLLQTAATAVPTKISASTARVQPKYLDISKYKPAQGNNFLRKNDAKSTLKPSVAETMKRSPSSSSMGLSRGDVTRASNRSAKSATSVMTSSGTTLSGRASSAVRRDASVNKQKEAELAMWKRRAKYDPMKAAAEDRRKKEEAKRMAQTTNLTTNEEFINESTNQTHNFQRQTSCDNQWTLGLREAGNEELELSD